MSDIIVRAMHEHIQLARRVEQELVDQMENLARVLIECVKHGSAIFWCGNGGSAADAQHLAAELIGRFQRERRAIASAAFTTDTSVLTAIGNDYSFSEIFSRQVEGLVRRGDALVGISTSGNSENVVLAVRKAKEKGATTLGLLGRDGGRLRQECDHRLVVPSNDTARIQEMHILIGHILCDLIEREVAGG
jgi:D-sedoheptulose 7-phosphate isomerase